MTLITDENGTRWVDTPPRKRRAPRTGGRFSALEVGQQLVKTYTIRWTRAGVEESSRHTYHAIVTDLWLDPVAGEENPWRGQMVAIASIGPDGRLSKKRGMSRHALACDGWHKTDIDYRAMCVARVAAMKAGDVVGIGAGRRIRARPKLPGGL